MNPRTGGSSFAQEEQALPAVEAATGRPLGVLHIYSPWTKAAPVSDLAAVSARGSIPLLDWGCGTNPAAAASGIDDQQIIAYGRALEAYGKPVFLRWCWEMNLVNLHPQLGGPTGFVAAWTHIWSIFHQVGAHNVAFVWCPGVSGADPAPYYPGDGYVDWIGVDGYDRSPTGSFSNVFSAFYRQWVGHGKPMMVAETGATGPGQASYLQGIRPSMANFPALKAVVYFDAAGPAADWQLMGAGLAAFGALARDPYFQPQ